MTDGILVDVKLRDDGKAAKASADVTIDSIWGDVTLCGFRVVHQDGKEPWVAFPKISYKDKDSGEYKNIPIVIPGRKFKHAVSEAVLQKYLEVSADGTPF